MDKTLRSLQGQDGRRSSEMMDSCAGAQYGHRQTEIGGRGGGNRAVVPVHSTVLMTTSSMVKVVRGHR